MAFTNQLGNPPVAEVTAIASGTYTAANTYSNVLQNTNGWKGIKAMLHITTLVSTNLTMTIYEVDSAGNAISLLATAALTADGELTIHPQVATATNKTLSNVAPSKVKIGVAPNAAGNNDVFMVTVNWLP